MRARRLMTAVVAAVLLCLPGAGPAQAQGVVVYRFKVTYHAPDEFACGGFGEGEIRVAGGQVEMYGTETGGTPALVAAGPLGADGTFRIDVARTGATFTMSGVVHADTITGSGKVSDSGSVCTLDLVGTRVDPGTPDPGRPSQPGQPGQPADSAEKEVDFDAASNSALTEAEVRDVLKRTKFTDPAVDHFFERARPFIERGVVPGSSKAAQRFLPTAILAEGLARTHDENDKPLFPVLLSIMRIDGPFAAAYQAGVDGTPEQQATLYRLIRLSIALNLPPP